MTFARQKCILIVSHVTPWPASHGNEIRLQRLLLWLRKRQWRIIFVLTNHSIDSAQQELIRSHVDRLELAHPHHPLLQGRRRRRSSRERMRRLYQYIWPAGFRRHAAASGKKSDLSAALCPPYVSALLKRLAMEEKIDIFFANYAFTIRAFSGLSANVKLICDSVEVFSMPRFDPAGNLMTPVLSFSAEEERNMLMAADTVIAIQSLEAAYLKRLLPGRSIVTVGIDKDLPQNPCLPSQTGEIIGIIGSDNLANLEGLEVFLTHSWPLIRDSRPKAQLRIAGKLSQVLEARLPDGLPEGVSSLGWIACLDDFYRDLRLVVNPVLRGTGLKIKTVEALSHCRPVVATPVAMEGIFWELEPAWRVCQNPQSMAAACIELLADSSLCDAMAQSARQFTILTLGSEKVYAPLDRILEQPTSYHST